MASPGEKLGELIVLGYNGLHERRPEPLGRRKGHQSRMEIRRRAEPNGIRKARHYNVSQPSASHAVTDARTHTVSFTQNRLTTTVVEYAEDAETDMYQIGRSSEPQIDFTVVDTWLGASASTSPNGSPLTPVNAKNFCSTISRYACRLLFSRDSEGEVRVFAGGFDDKRNIFLGEKATKWQRRNGEVDGLTTNGILILNPRTASNRASSGSRRDSDAERSMYVWREVSVDGDVYTLRSNRSATTRGDIVKEERNVLEDGCLMDLCGATVLWRTTEGLADTPTMDQLERKLAELNAGKPTCPVNLNTLVVPRHRRRPRASNGSAARESLPLDTGFEGDGRQSATDRQPYIYTECGHVLGRHDWGHQDNGVSVEAATGGAVRQETHACPMCRKQSERLVALCAGMEPAFHLDSEDLDHAFLPCGHLASQQTVEYWSRIPLPHGTSSFYAVCPFCTQPLSQSRPFIRVILDLQAE